MDFNILVGTMTGTAELVAEEVERSIGVADADHGVQVLHGRGSSSPRWGPPADYPPAMPGGGERAAPPRGCWWGCAAAPTSLSSPCRLPGRPGSRPASALRP